MIKLWKRLSSKEFQIMFQSGVFFSGKNLSIVVKRDFSCSHVGFTSKKGKKTAVERNYFKRILREAFIDVQNFVPENWSIILILAPTKGKFSVDQIRLELLGLLDTAKFSLQKQNEKTTPLFH